MKLELKHPAIPYFVSGFNAGTFWKNYYRQLFSNFLIPVLPVDQPLYDLLNEQLQWDLTPSKPTKKWNFEELSL